AVGTAAIVAGAIDLRADTLLAATIAAPPDPAGLDLGAWVARRGRRLDRPARLTGPAGGGLGQPGNRGARCRLRRSSPVPGGLRPRSGSAPAGRRRALAAGLRHPGTDRRRSDRDRRDRDLAAGRRRGGLAADDPAMAPSPAGARLVGQTALAERALRQRTRFHVGLTNVKRRRRMW